MFSAADTTFAPELIAAVILLPVTVLLAFILSRNSWTWAEVVIAAFCGFVFTCFPEHALKHQLNGESTNKELFFARLYGAVLLATGYSWFRTKQTRDATVPITLISSRVFTASILFMMQLFTYYEESLSKGKRAKSKVLPTGTPDNATDSIQASTASLQWSEENFVAFYALPTALWAVINLIHLLRSHDFNFYPQHNIRLNNHLRIDAWLMLMYGAAMMSFPSQLVKVMLSSVNKPSCVVLHIVRATGAFCVGESIISLQAPGFLHARDKHALFATRVIMVVLTSAVLSYGCCYQQLIDLNTLMYAVSLQTPVLLNAVVGLTSDMTAFLSMAQLMKTPRVSDGSTDAALYQQDGKKVE